MKRPALFLFAGFPVIAPVRIRLGRFGLLLLFDILAADFLTLEVAHVLALTRFAAGHVDQRRNRDQDYPLVHDVPPFTKWGAAVQCA